MSISSALANAGSGLRATAKSAEVVSSNVANAATDGYGRREIRLTSANVGGTGVGVKVAGIDRIVNDAAIADRRLADANLGQSTEKTTHLAAIESSIGLPGDDYSLSSMIAKLEGDLAIAASDPGSSVRLNEVVASATSVARKINTIADGIQDQRTAADASIAQQVDDINYALTQVDELNDNIQRMVLTGGDPSPLIDERQMQIDRIASYLPIKEVKRDNGTVAIVTTSGAALVDGKAAQLSFTPTRIITADLTIQNTGLSSIELVGAAHQLGDTFASIDGGSLSAAFEIRDEIAVEQQLAIDGLARHLIERLSSSSVDPTLSIGESGLFSDGSLDFDPANETGIGQRISVNNAVDPQTGGDVNALRDGIGATVARAIGDNSILSAMKTALSESGVPASGGFQVASSFGGLATNFLSDVSALRQSEEFRMAAASSQVSALKQAELAYGVSTDDEMQKLMIIEQAYAANARVIQSVDEMLQLILRI